MCRTRLVSPEQPVLCIPIRPINTRCLALSREKPQGEGYWAPVGVTQCIEDACNGRNLCEKRGQLHTSCSDALLLFLDMPQAWVPDMTPVCLLQLISYSLLHQRHAVSIASSADYV